MSDYKQLFDREDLTAAIKLFLEFRNVHGYGLDDAIVAGANEVSEGYDAGVDLFMNPLEGEDNTSYEPFGHKVQRENADLRQQLAQANHRIKEQTMVYEGELKEFKANAEVLAKQLADAHLKLMATQDDLVNAKVAIEMLQAEVSQIAILEEVVEHLEANAPEAPIWRYKNDAFLFARGSDYELIIVGDASVGQNDDKHLLSNLDEAKAILVAHGFGKRDLVYFPEVKEHHCTNCGTPMTAKEIVKVDWLDGQFCGDSCVDAYEFDQGEEIIPATLEEVAQYEAEYQAHLAKQVTLTAEEIDWLSTFKYEGDSVFTSSSYRDDIPKSLSGKISINAHPTLNWTRITLAGVYNSAVNRVTIANRRKELGLGEQ